MAQITITDINTDCITEESLKIALGAFGVKAANIFIDYEKVEPNCFDETMDDLSGDVTEIEIIPLY